MPNVRIALRKAERLISSRSQSKDWECIPRGSASGQATGGGASENGFPAWRLGTS
ncbi:MULTISPECIES: hypothetical protein [unclassified Nostoc]|uniref:hypothetical protein n=1 Tax=unclassified Nostoc TaxID=2593658 RepID=UPI002FFC8EFE